MPFDSECPVDTPWGRADSVVILAPGIFNVSTPGHGGIYLSPENNAKIPAVARDPAFSFGGFRAAGWYEEDCDWSIVVLFFPALFGEKERSRAESIAKEFRPEAWQAHRESLEKI